MSSYYNFPVYKKEFAMIVIGTAPTAAENYTILWVANHLSNSRVQLGLRIHGEISIANLSANLTNYSVAVVLGSNTTNFSQFYNKLNALPIRAIMQLW